MSQGVVVGGGAQLEGSAAAAIGIVVDRRAVGGVGRRRRLGIVKDDRLMVRLGLGLHLLLLLLLVLLLLLDVLLDLLLLLLQQLLLLMMV